MEQKSSTLTLNRDLQRNITVIFPKLTVTSFENISAEAEVTKRRYSSECFYKKENDKVAQVTKYKKIRCGDNKFDV